MIEIKNLKVSYGDKVCLHDISCVFPKEKMTCIIGKNGSGKSTLIKAIMRDVPFDGTIYFDGTDLSRMKYQRAARKIAYLPQIRPLPNLDVETFVSHGRFPYLGFSKILRNEDKTIINHVVEKTDIGPFLKKNLADLSGGERQRVYIAMAMAQDTEVIILDEPMTYMDMNHQMEIVKLLQVLKEEGKTIIYTSHDLPQAFTCGETIVLIDDGRICISGTREKVVRSGEIKKIFNVDLIEDDSANAYYKYKMITLL